MRPGKVKRARVSAFCLLLAGVLLRYLSDPESEDMFHRNVSLLSADYTALYSTKYLSLHVVLSVLILISAQTLNIIVATFDMGYSSF